MRFTYSSGQRPLDGYTLKRGIGRGGFGEVYFAISDGGKEVALKLVRGDRDIELRGVTQCLNLKHPNLVSLFDLKSDGHGDKWVVMEYVAGEPLSVVLARHPEGLPRELAREWFIGLSRAVAYLHDHGIVHRDLKPGNIFLENGTVKVGDYGLSKSISMSQRTAQTQSVGTVHYMAPEISTGNYNKQIDVYAAGIILYEMLTGHVPFEGESAGEILMKHLTAPPDLRKLPADYLPIVQKALAKNPAQRYASMAEMARAVEQVGSRSYPKENKPVGTAVPLPLPNEPKKPDPIPAALPAYSFRTQLLELLTSMTVAVVFAGLGALLWAAAGADHAVSLFFLSVVASWVVMLPAKVWTERRGDAWGRRIVMLLLGSLVGVVSLWMEGWKPGAPFDSSEGIGGMVRLALFSGSGFNEAAYLCYYALGFFALRWWRMADRRRTRRFSLFPILASGFWSGVLLLLIGTQYWHGAVVLMMASAIVQLSSPWEQPLAVACAKRLRLRYA
jgi:eukaryotic-like serine/threonine-protein kinase